MFHLECRGVAIIALSSTIQAIMKKLPRKPDFHLCSQSLRHAVQAFIKPLFEKPYVYDI